MVAVVLGLYLYLRSPIDLLPDRMGVLGLLDDLIVLSIGIYWLTRRIGERPREQGAERPAASPIPSDPYVLLEVGYGASPEEITRAYREQLKRYHPDRVATLGEELQRLAHERTVAIQRAYEAIGPQARST